jgi:hypothetical protein
MILLQKGFNIPAEVPKLLNCNHPASASHCIKGSEANAERVRLSKFVPVHPHDAPVSFRSELRNVINSKSLFQLRNLIHNLEVAILAE